MSDKAYGGWMHAGFAAWSLGIEASMVIGLRLAKFATGQDPAGIEAKLMVDEKLRATMELQTKLMTAAFTATPLQNTNRTLAFYRRKVLANHHRLTHDAG